MGRFALPVSVIREARPMTPTPASRKLLNVTDALLQNAEKECAELRARVAELEAEPHKTHSVDFLEGIAEGTAATIERCAQELEAAYAECNTLNLLHGAARLRALKEKP